MKLHIVNAGYFRLDGGAMHGVVPKSMWQKVNPADDYNMCPWAMRCLLIEQGGRLILIDTGMGHKQDEKFFSHFQPHGDDSLEKNILAAGYTPDDITDVFLTHLHFDHCGGAIKKDGDNYKPTFKNATYWSNTQQWQAATQPNAREKASFLKENILPIKESGQLQMIEVAQGAPWVEGIDIFYVEGHTEHMMLPLINYNGQKILYCADLIPSAGHVSLPWVMAYDMRPLNTLDEKAYLLNRAVDENWHLFLEHDPRTACISVERTERGIRQAAIIDLS